ncbi:MAG: DUF4296 domain-containing protein, partial [Crocinitomicaceae bacterium]
ERVPEPKNLIPKKKMVSVIKEMMILESHVQATYGQINRYYKVMQKSGDSLLATFELDRETYESSIDYYGSRQEEIKGIYTEALEQMNEDLGKLESNKSD